VNGYDRTDRFVGEICATKKPNRSRNMYTRVPRKKLRPYTRRFYLSIPIRERGRGANRTSVTVKQYVIVYLRFNWRNFSL